MTPQKIALPDLTTSEEQLEKRSFSPDLGDYNPYSATGAYNSPYCSTSAVTTVVTHCLLPHNPIAEVKGLRRTMFVDQVMGDIYDYGNQLFSSLGSADHKIMVDL